ncbi:hypothetical protein EG68_04284 [Paragonimus skrjabini miyazakii]|uniref:Uncharacterized protein n=1 Tax=Paragonimus skrjabini miyazakii TaxID=59628 RepID=A0A8S9YUY8_9TREM|nr:hypothetical protein EG68_04284 [Paragonimus skrjabini miyazakii]
MEYSNGIRNVSALSDLDEITNSINTYKDEIIAARKFAIKNPEMQHDITIWYSQTGSAVALSTRDNLCLLASWQSSTESR